MKKHLTFAYPGDLEMKTGGYGYDRRIIEGLRALDWNVSLLPLGDGFPVPTATGRDEAEHRLSALPDGAMVIIDGLAFGILGGWAEREAERLCIIALVHHPLALESGLSSDEQASFRLAERKALSFARHIIVTSASTQRELTTHYGAEPENITIALPGTEKGQRISRQSLDRPPHILSIGSFTRRKGHDVLLAALGMLADLDWRATIIGNRELDPVTVRELEIQLRETDVADRIRFVGAVEDTSEFYAEADIFALASRYEGYGMVFAEALSHGLPVVACRAGAIPDVVPPDAGILVPVDSSQEFGAALRRLLCEPQERKQRAEAAHRAASLLPGWRDTSSIISDRLDALS